MNRQQVPPRGASIETASGTGGDVMEEPVLVIESREHAIHVRFRVDAPHDPRHLSVRIDDERGALERVLSIPLDAVGPPGLVIRVGEDLEGQSVLRP